MFNIFEQPWLLLGLSIIALIVIYIITLDRKLYWLSFLVLVCSTMLYLLLETTILPFGGVLKIILLWLLPIAVIISIILIILDMVEQRSERLRLIPIVLCLFGFGLDLFVKTDAEKIKMVVNNGKSAFANEDINALSEIVSEDYKDSYHADKRMLLEHCRPYLNEPVFQRITTTSMQTERKGNQASVTIVVFISFDSEGFVYENYGVTTAKVGARINLKKGKDRNWRIYEVEIVEVNQQPFNWQRVDLRDITD